MLTNQVKAKYGLFDPHTSYGTQVDTIEPRVLMLTKHNGVQLPATFIGWSTSRTSKVDQDAIWGVSSDGEPDHRKLLHSTADNSRRFHYDIKEFHDHWKGVKRNKMKQRVDAYVRSKVDMVSADRELSWRSMEAERRANTEETNGQETAVEISNENQDNEPTQDEDDRPVPKAFDVRDYNDSCPPHLLLRVINRIYMACMEDD